MAAPITKTKTKTKKSHELATHTIKAPAFAYAHLELFRSSNISNISNSSNSNNNNDTRPIYRPGIRNVIPPRSTSTTPTTAPLDALQVRSYCTAALRQSLGAMGVGIPLDILKVGGSSCWLRLPRDDLGPFSAAITAWQGTRGDDGAHHTLRVAGCSDWLGALVGREGEHDLWTG
ncbi:hypothetical protein F4778DRAFT_132771 [Xylariomycetidae sp. FL2044]|nr:hypothetical protein F4778DRAFT_132771 [Xylariomycetidae sp. FL2044]